MAFVGVVSFSVFVYVVLGTKIWAVILMVVVFLRLRNDDDQGCVSVEMPSRRVFRNARCVSRSLLVVNGVVSGVVSGVSHCGLCSAPCRYSVASIHVVCHHVCHSEMISGMVSDY